MVELVSPTAASCVSAVFMGSGHVIKPWLLDLSAMYRILYIVDIMDITGRMELWHKQGVSVPELVLHKWSVEFFETKSCKLVLHPLQIVAICVVTARNKTGSRCVDSIWTE